MSKPRLLTITGMILFAAISRLIPHPWNVTPVAAMALFGGATFDDKRLAFIVPLAALTLSNIFLGWHVTMVSVYVCFIATVLVGRSLRHHVTAGGVGAASVASSVMFFLVTNFAHWAMTPEYPRTMAGLTACYTAAIPFFRNSLIGDLCYAALFFGLFELAQRRIPALREASAA